MPNWTKSMKQTFEYYIVDPYTWKDKESLTTVIDSRVDIDSESETRGSASFTTTTILGECYIRIYLITIQNGIKEKFPLGTYLVQTPSYSFDGKVMNVTLDAYTPLTELKENKPTIGYYIPKGTNVMDTAYNMVNDHSRCPVVKPNDSECLFYDFVAEQDDSWITYINDLINSVNYYIDLDELGRVIFKPKQRTETLQPTWIYTDDNSSILHPAVSLDNDLYGIPNIVEVIYSTDEYYIYSKVKNTDSDSPISIVNRGREVIHRVTDPDISGTPSQGKVDKYAEDLLKEMSSLQYSITYTHGYCPVKVGDCVLLNYKRVGLNNVKARVISQSISCIPGTPVEEKVIFTIKLWGE